MQLNVSAGAMTFLAAIAITIDFIGGQTEVQFNPVVMLGLKALGVFITAYLGKTNTGTYHHVIGTSKRTKSKEPSLLVKP